MKHYISQRDNQIQYQYLISKTHTAKLLLYPFYSLTYSHIYILIKTFLSLFTIYYYQSLETFEFYLQCLYFTCSSTIIKA